MNTTVMLSVFDEDVTEVYPTIGYEENSVTIKSGDLTLFMYRDRAKELVEKINKVLGEQK